MQTEREIRILLTKSLKDPYYVFSNKDCHTPAFCVSFIEQCNDVVFDTPQAALELAFIARRLAQETRDNHLIAKSVAMVGSGYRAEGVFARADHFINSAEELASGCRCCLAEIYRRKGVNFFHQNKLSEMYRVLTKAAGYCDTLGDTDGVGRILIHRGTGLWLQGQTDEALQDERKGLELFTRDKTPSRYYLAGMVNIATFLAHPKEGLDKEFEIQRCEEAQRQLSMIRQELKGGKRQHEVVRVILRWIEGLICAKQEERRKAFRLLISARKGLERLGLRSEYLAVSADLAKLYKVGTPRMNDEQVIEIAEECLRKVRVTDKERDVLSRLCQFPQKATIGELRQAAACRVPVLI